jgi:hypothetical protein
MSDDGTIDRSRPGSVPGPVDDTGPDEATPPQDPGPSDFSYLAVALVLVAVAVAAAIAARGITGRAAPWPWLLVGTLLVLTLWEAASRAHRVLAARRDGAVLGSPRLPGIRARRRAFYAGWLVALAAVALTAGFGWATLIFLPIYQWAAGSRNLLRIGLVTAGMVGALHLMFAELAGIPLW